MKRRKSHSDDSSDDVIKPSPPETSSRDWQRRDQDPDRSHHRSSSSSSHARKIAYDEDQEISRPPPRKRFDREMMEGFDRRNSFDRRRDSPTRGLYSADRIYRSESFSGIRREFPKGFRSERDRSRREGSSGSSWWKSNGLREVGGVSGEFRKSPSLDEGRRGRIRAWDSTIGGGEQSQKSEMGKKENSEARVRVWDSSSGGEDWQKLDTQSQKLEMGKKENSEGRIRARDSPTIGEQSQKLEMGKKENWEGRIRIRDLTVGEIKKSPSSESDLVGRRSHVSSPDDRQGRISVRDSVTTGGQSDKLERGKKEKWEGRIWVRDELKKLPSVESDLVGRRRHTPMSEDGQGRDRVRDSPSGGEQSQKSETQSQKSETGKKENWESGSSSEMEEGELEPDQEPDSEQEQKRQLEGPEVGLGVECLTDAKFDVRKEAELGLENCGASDCAMDAELEKKETVEIENKLVADDNDRRDEVVNDAVKVAYGVGIESELIDKAENALEFDAKYKEDCQVKVPESINEVSEVECIPCKEKQDIFQKEILTVQHPQRDEEKSNKHGQRAEGEQFVNAHSNSYLQGKKNDDYQMDDKASTDGKLETKLAESMSVNIDVEKQGGIDLEVEPREHSHLLPSTESKFGIGESNQLTLSLIAEKPKEEDKDKGKSLAVYMPNKQSSGNDNIMEGLNGRGFDLVFQSESVQSAKLQNARVSTEKNKEVSKMESLDLSLSLPGGFAGNPQNPTCSKPGSPGRARSFQSVPSLFPTDSDGFSMSVSFTNSQPFSHNPSCSLNQNSMDNFEHSVGSRPIFQPVEHASSTPIWQAQASNESKRKSATPLLQRVLFDGSTSYSSHHNLNQNHPKSNGLMLTPSIKSSPAHSIGSRDSKLEQIKDKRQLARERSSNSLLKNEEQGHIVLNGACVTEKIVSKIITEPLHLSSRMLQDMKDSSIAYLKQTICEMLLDTEKSRKVHALQEALKNRSDFTLETLAQCPGVLLEILVALKTGLPGFIKRGNTVSSKDLCEIFLDLRCRNLACRNMIPVDDCDCKVCTQKVGFCSACMCLVCHKFDNASNTCSWVGCDVCEHWCHTDCGLTHSYVRSEQNASGNQKMSEMQFHCVACNHPSEMFGFVKEVFRTCANDWKAETLAKELQYVKRIFAASNDVRGKRLHDMAGQMLLKLENNVTQREVVSYLMDFLSGEETNMGDAASFPAKELSLNGAGLSNGIPSSSRDVTWCQPISSQKASLHESVGILSSMDLEQGSRKTMHADVQANIIRKVTMNVETKPILDELDSVVRLKQAEAKLYQERADDARKEAEGLKRIALAKNVKIDEDYSSRITRLRLTEAEERRRQKLEEVKAVERANSEYFNMKMRMEADIKDLLLKMEATRRNFNT